MGSYGTKERRPKSSLESPDKLKQNQEIQKGKEEGYQFYYLPARN